MAIKINYDVLNKAKVDLTKISHIDVHVYDPFIKSMGLSVDTEREILEMLKEIYEVVLPDLFNNTSALLGVIINEFKNADNGVASEISNTGETNAQTWSSQTPHDYQIKGRS